MCERNWLAPSSFGATRDLVEPDASYRSRVARLRDLECPLAGSPIPRSGQGSLPRTTTTSRPGHVLDEFVANFREIWVCI